MARKIRHTNREMEGDRTLGGLGPHVGENRIISRSVAGNYASRHGDVWTVHWWPGRELTKDEAVRAVVLADSVSTRQAWIEGDPVRHVSEQLAARLGLTLDQAIELSSAATA